MELALDAVLIIAERYALLAREKAEKAEGKDRERFLLMAETAYPESGAPLPVR